MGIKGLKNVGKLDSFTSSTNPSIHLLSLTEMLRIKVETTDQTLNNEVQTHRFKNPRPRNPNIRHIPPELHRPLHQPLQLVPLRHIAQLELNILVLRKQLLSLRRKSQVTYEDFGALLEGEGREGEGDTWLMMMMIREGEC